ncbi:hypothetical protein [Lysinibacillus sp. FSL M8-0134]|uniref:hypothetical protein n=1 Tax=Lysinibacillus sp. FSL M8-0134 TaxID=2921717 RepID=UPI00311A8A52
MKRNVRLIINVIVNSYPKLEKNSSVLPSPAEKYLNTPKNIGIVIAVKIAERNLI